MSFLGLSGLVVVPSGGLPGPPGPPGPPAVFHDEIFTPALNQVLFVLAALPVTPIIFSVNGVIYQTPSDYGVVGLNVTWTNALFNLSPVDTVQIYYEV
jgi:hypothetical protein